MKTDKPNFWGIVVYEIIGDGCLNGVWTNNESDKGLIMNEISRKKDGQESNIAGDYTVAWIEPNQEPTCGTLEISEDYSLEWKGKKGNSIFRGKGVKTGTKQLVAIYWKTDEPICFGGND